MWELYQKLHLLQTKNPALLPQIFCLCTQMWNEHLLWNDSFMDDICGKFNPNVCGKKCCFPKCATEKHNLLHEKLNPRVLATWQTPPYSGSKLPHEVTRTWKNQKSWASKLPWWDAKRILVITRCKMHCLFNIHCSWHHSFALCKHVPTKRVEECEGWRIRGGEGGESRKNARVKVLRVERS